MGDFDELEETKKMSDETRLDKTIAALGSVDTCLWLLLVGSVGALIISYFVWCR